MSLHKPTLASMFLFLLSGCDSNINAAKEMARSRVNDPGSVQFRDVSLCPNREVVQGEFNYRTEAGGYGEFVSFFYWRGHFATLNSANEMEFKIFQTLGNKCFKSMAFSGGGSPETSEQGLDSDISQEVNNSENAMQHAMNEL